MAEEVEAVAKQVVNVPIVKAKTTLAVTIDDIPADVWAEVILQGLKVVYNRGASKLTSAAFKGDKEALAKAALEKAQEQHDLVMTSKIKFSGAKKKSGVAGKVMTKARQFAKDLVKTELRKAGYKVSHIEASEITRLANLYLESENGPAMIAKAEAFLAEQDALASGEDTPDFLKSVKISDKLVAADAAKKSKGGILSAKQAGKVAKRAKAGAEAAAIH